MGLGKGEQSGHGSTHRPVQREAGEASPARGRRPVLRRQRDVHLRRCPGRARQREDHRPLGERRSEPDLPSARESEREVVRVPSARVVAQLSLYARRLSRQVRALALAVGLGVLFAAGAGGAAVERTVRAGGSFGGSGQSAHSRDHAAQAEGAPHGPRGDREPERRNARGRHARLLAVGGLCHAPAPRGRLPTTAEQILLRLLPRDRADRVRANSSGVSALREGPGLRHDAVLRRRKCHCSGRPGRAHLGIERLRALGFRGAPARRRRPHEARRVHLLSEGRQCRGKRCGALR